MLGSKRHGSDEMAAEAAAAEIVKGGGCISRLAAPGRCLRSRLRQADRQMERGYTGPEAEEGREG